MIAILINCITLGSYQPCHDAKCETTRCQWLKTFDHTIFLFFFMEMLIKMIAMGVSSAPQAYLADYWNRLDCFIVIAGGFEYILDIGNVNLNAIRTVRVLRPLRAINRIPSMRILVTLLLDTLPMLGNVLLLCFFVFFIFGIIGVQLWSGVLRQRCFINLPANVSKPSYVPDYYRLPHSDKEYLCSTSKDNGLHRCQDLPTLRARDSTSLCQNSFPFDWQPPAIEVQRNGSNWQQLSHESRYLDGIEVPLDLVPGDEASPFLVKQMSPLIAQSIAQPAYAPDHRRNRILAPIRQRRAQEMSISLPYDAIDLTTETRMRRDRNQKINVPPVVETNLNSDQFSRDQSTACDRGVSAQSDLARRRCERLKAAKRRKGSCINWNKYYTECKAGDNNPFQGTISFDNVGMAWTTIFLVISLEGWSDIMYLLQDSHSFWVWTYFVLLIVIGSFFMINLCLVVIATQFSATKKREMERMRQERLKFSSSSTLTGNSEPTNCYTVIVKLIARFIRRTRMSFVRSLKRWKWNRAHKRQCERRFNYDDRHQITGGTNLLRKQLRPNSSSSDQKHEARSQVESERAQQETSSKMGQMDANLRRNSWRQQSFRSRQPRSCQAHESSLPMSEKACQLEDEPKLRSNSNGDQEALKSTKRVRSHSRSHHLRYRNAPVTSQRDCEIDEIEINFCPTFIGKNERVQKFCKTLNESIKNLVDHRYFQRLILLAILINAISMGIEYHNQPDELTEAVEISNTAFACLFLVEMILKLMAHGFYEYLIDGFNCFDGCIVILSILELLESSGSGQSGLNVLRTFRLLRILKLVRFMPALQRQLVIMLRTLDNVAVFFALLVLFIFIFSILGMNLFGCKFCETLPDGTERCDRKNFNSLLWSLVTVFQILTQEDWNVVLFNGMEKTSHWAALYFVLLMTFGNYVLFNLLVAILVEGFSQEEDLKVVASPSSSFRTEPDASKIIRSPPVDPPDPKPTKLIAGSTERLTLPVSTTFFETQELAPSQRLDQSASMSSLPLPSKLSSVSIEIPPASPRVFHEESLTGLKLSSQVETLDQYKSFEKSDDVTTNLSIAAQIGQTKRMISNGKFSQDSRDGENSRRTGSNWSTSSDSAENQLMSRSFSFTSNGNETNTTQRQKRRPLTSPKQLETPTTDKQLDLVSKKIFNFANAPIEACDDMSELTARDTKVTKTHAKTNESSFTKNLRLIKGDSAQCRDAVSSLKCDNGDDKSSTSSQNLTMKPQETGFNNEKDANDCIESISQSQMNIADSTDGFSEDSRRVARPLWNGRQNEFLHRTAHRSGAKTSQATVKLFQSRPVDIPAIHDKTGAHRPPLPSYYNFAQSFCSTTKSQSLVAKSNSMTNQSQSLGSPSQREKGQQCSSFEIGPQWPIDLDSSANFHKQPTQMGPNVTAMTLRNAPKRLIYFYDLDDDIEEEIDFLSKSLESKSYAISMLSHNDPHLDSIARSVSCPKTGELSPQMMMHEKYRQSLLKSSPIGQKLDEIESVEILETLGLDSPIVDLEQSLTSASKRLSSRSSCGQKSRESSIMSGSEHRAAALVASNSATKLPLTRLYSLGPHWSSLPSHLNRVSITMMRYYQLSLTQNFHLGRRERTMLAERDRFDRSCCRVDSEAYERAIEFWDSVPTDPRLISKDASPRVSTDDSARRPSRFLGHNVNLGVIYEPFESKTLRQESSTPADSLEPRASPSLSHGRKLSGKLSKRQRELLDSFQNFASAIRSYAERRDRTSHAETDKAVPLIGLNKTTQALRRGSVIVLSKLKLMQPEPVYPLSSPTSGRGVLQSNKELPRLSLTRAESIAIDPAQLPGMSSIRSGRNSPQEAQSEVMIRMESSSQESLQNVAHSGDQSHRASISSASIVAIQGAPKDLDISDLREMVNSPSSLLGLKSPPSNRHSIANLPTVGSRENRESISEGVVGERRPVRPTSWDASGATAPNRGHHEGIRLIQWLGKSWRRSSQYHDEHQGTRKSSFNSQFSSDIWQFGDDLGSALRPSWRRRRSFSGPFEWFWREDRIEGQDLCINPRSNKQRNTKRRAKKIRAQRSNSSDYHSLNNRRVYRLVSRGFQTKLRGVFYVVTRDPLASKSSTNQTDGRSANLIGGFELHSNQPDLRGSNGDIDLSFPNSSIEDTLNNNLSTSNSQDQPIARISSVRKHERSFLYYFKWNKWMIQRRHYSLFVFSPRSRVRKFCCSIISRREFDYFVLFFISMNCVTLAMERPIIPPNSKEREFLTIANYYFTFMFTLEMALKVIAKGLYYGHGAYLSDNWNIMDGALVGLSLFDLILSIVADRSPRIFGILRVFRLLRSLRPLRVINRLMGLKLVVQTLLLSLRPIGNIVLICCTFFIIFGILGVQLFKGTFYYCDGPDPLEIMRTVRTKEDCLMDHRSRWINRKYNFDNLGQALMALFVLSSKDGWVNIMYTGLDAVGVDMQPRENYNEWRLLYFISFLLLVAFFVLNMFVGVVVENFHRCRKEQELEEKARRAEKRQRKLDKRRRKLREPPYYSNYGKFRSLLHRWVTGGYFDLLIAAVIGFNVIFMSLEHYQMPFKLIHLLRISNYVFTAAFILEAVIKSSALGMRRYLKDRWNQLDVMIVALSVVGIIFEELESFTFPINPTLLRVLRVMRIARVLKLLKMAKGIRALLDTVMQALPQVGNLGLLFFLLFFIFAALGVELFGRLECSEDYPCSGLMDQHAHFQNFGVAFLTLFRVATGDNWNGIMKDTLRDKCDPSSNCLRNCCVSQIIAPLYFVVFVLLAQFVLVNVVVAVLMKHLEESHHEMEIDEEYELDKQLAEELAAKKRALMEARDRQYLFWV